MFWRFPNLGACASNEMEYTWRNTTMTNTVIEKFPKLCTASSCGLSPKSCNQVEVQLCNHWQTQIGKCIGQSHTPWGTFLSQSATAWNPLFCSVWLGGRFGFFRFFSGRGGGRGSLIGQEGGGTGFFFMKIPRRGGVSRRGRGQEGVCSKLGNFWGGRALNIFFQGRNVHQVDH